MSANSSAANTDQRYFRALEDAFIRLRGSPLLLSPADWQQAQAWRKDGIPLEIVVGALEEVFRKRRERGAKGGISSLRYCKRAVEAAWQEAQELLLAAPGGQEATPLETTPRLRALADALPPGPHWDGLRKKVLGLAEESSQGPSGRGDEASMESALASLDGEALRLAESALDDSARQRLDTTLESALANLRHRLPEAQVEVARDRLRRGHLRQTVGLPLLSLFAPEVEKALEGLPSD